MHNHASTDRRPLLERARQLAVDDAGTGRLEVILAVALLLIALVTDAVGDASAGRYGVTIATCLIGAAAGQFPRLASVGMGGMLAVMLVLPPAFEGLAVHALLIVVFALGRRGLRRWRMVVVGSYLVLIVSATARLSSDPTEVAIYVLAWGILLAMAWAVGEAFHLLALQEGEARRFALRDQRHAVARDLHDTVAQGLVLIAMRVEQARIAGRSSDDLEFIGRTSLRAAQGLRTMMTLLRDERFESPARAVSPLGEALGQAEADLREQGFEPVVTVAGDLARVPDRVAAAFVRVVDEASVNIRKHGAPDRPCVIMVEVEESQLEAVFVNGIGGPAASDLPPLGVQGMRERVGALGGTLAAGEGGNQWITQVVLPFR